MKTLIVPIPIFDSKMSVEAYRLNSRSGQSLRGMMDDQISVSDAVLSPGLDLIKALGAEPLAGDRPLYVDINVYQLLMRAPLSLGIAPERLVFVLPGSITPDGDVVDRCSQLKELGYGLAVSGIPESLTSNPMYSLIDSIIIDVESYATDGRFLALVKGLSGMKRIVLSNIHEMEKFNMLAGIDNTLYAGDFFNQPITKGKSEISPVKINALTLLRQINEEDFDLSDIAGTIERDPSLSISLLRFINTVMPNKINSIRNAVAILGQKEVKRWATAALSIQLAEDRPGEITRLSLIRARFAESLGKTFEMGVFSQSLFMMGLFSLLDVILEKPMEAAVREVALDEKVRAALVEKTGDFYKILELIHAYEHANWDRVAIMMVQYGLDLEGIISAFIEALVWYKALLDAIGAE